MYCNMKKFTLMSVLWGVLAMTLVESASYGNPQNPSQGVAPGSNEFGPSVTGFTLDILKSFFNSTDISTTSENKLFCSSSLYKTMIALYLGNTGGSKTKMEKALHIDNVVFDIADNFKKWKSFKREEVEEHERLYYHRSFLMKQTMKQLLGEMLVQVNTESPDVAETINNWANEMMPEGETLITQDKAKGQKLLPVSLAKSKPTWKLGQPELMTNTLSFHPNGGQDVTVDAIEIVSPLKYHKSEELKSTIFSIEYNKPQFSYLVFLPDESQTISGLTELLTVDRLNDVIRNLSEDKIVLQMPQFNLQQLNSIKGMCEVLGMCDLLKPNTKDLSGFTTDPGLYVTEFLQKVEFKVHADASPQPQAKPQYGNAEVFTVNRPFLFMVYDHTFEMPVLAGTIMNPKQ